MENELEILVEEILKKVNFENTSELKKKLVKLYSLIKTDPSLLSKINNPAGLGKCFVLML